VNAPLFGFELRTCMLEQGELRYRAGGSGAPLVYVHAAGGPKLSPALRQLAGRYRILAPVLPGFDGSPTLAGVAAIPDLARLVAQFARQVVAGPYFLLGQSLGGHVACWTAVLDGGNVRKLVLECPAGFRQSGTRPEGDPVRRLYAHPERIPDEPQYRAGASEANRQAADRYRGAPLDRPLLDRLGGICCPTLLLHGSADRTIGVEASELAARHIPGARLERIDDAGHVIEVDQPATFTRLVDEFLAAA
jgi:pimeloyl-ACP methyl ester carboxylesterase